MLPWQSGATGREEMQTVHLDPTSGRWLPDHVGYRGKYGTCSDWTGC